MASLATATAILLPIYQINSQNIVSRTLYPFGMNVVFGTAGLNAQPNASTELNDLQAGGLPGGALIYSKIISPTNGDTVFFSSKTVAEIMTLAGFS